MQVMDEGTYSVTRDDGESVVVDIAEALEKAVAGSVLYRPDHDWPPLPSGGEKESTTIEVWNMTTLEASRKLYLEGGTGDIAVLNFASARNPGGGFLRGAQAQEESLARNSGLYACLTSRHCEGMYRLNSDSKSCLYSHCMIYSPNVPVFKDDEGELLEEWYPLSFISAPAVNAGVVRKRERNADATIEATMRERMRRVLRVAAEHRHETLVLGAFGCGVFDNRPADVARLFADLLMKESSPFYHKFSRVIFAIIGDRRGGGAVECFMKAFGLE